MVGNDWSRWHTRNSFPTRKSKQILKQSKLYTHWNIRGLVKMNKLLNIYNLSLDYPDVSGAEQLEILEIRDQIANFELELSIEERKILFEADKKLIINAASFYQEMSRFINFADYRVKNNILSRQWWWYLDVLGNVSNYLIPVAA